MPSPRSLSSRCKQLALLVSLMAATGVVQATAVNLSPLSLAMVDTDRAVGLTVSNQEREAALLQVRVMRWRQVQGRNVYDPAEGWLVSPPMFKLEGGSAQLLRVLRRQIKPVEHEESYRVFVDELPPADAPSTGAVRVLMRYSLPLFVQPARAILPEVYWTLQQCGDQWTLLADNRGQSHLKLLGYQLVQSGKTLLQTRTGLLGYVLAGQSYRWTVQEKLPVLGSDQGLEIRMQSGQGDMQAPVTVIRGSAACSAQP